MRGNGPRRSAAFPIAFGAMMTALALLCLMVASLAFSGRVALTAIAGLFVGASLATLGYVPAVLTYAASGLLGLLLAPGKEMALLYLIGFGLYPILKSLIEQHLNAALEWLVKLLCCNVVLAVSLLVLRRLLFPQIQVEGMLLAGLWLGLNLVFVAYDICFSRLMTLYQVRLLPRLGRK